MPRSASERVRAIASGTRVLVAKDLRELRPWGVLCLAFALVDVILPLFGEQVDLRPVSETLSLIGGSRLQVTWVLAFAIATGLGTREDDEGTLRFLDGLPLSRAHAYAVKCAVAWGMVAVIPTLALLTIVVLHALSSGSLDAALRPDLLLARYALNLASIGHGVLVGAAFGFLRSLTWLAAGVVGSLLVVIVEYVPRVAWLSPLQLGEVERGDGAVFVDSELMLAQLAIASCALLLGLRGFARAGRPSAADLRKRPALKALVSVGTALALMAMLGLWQAEEVAGAATQARGDGARGLEPVFPVSPPAQTETAHYRISYPAVRSEEALALAAGADSVFERVHALLGEATGERIDIDASGSARNTEGTAYLGRLRMQLGPDMERILAHETAHVVAQRMAGADRDWLWRKARVLDEGLATWVEKRYASEQDPAADNLVLAALHERRELIPAELADLERLSEARDQNLKYTAGEAIIQAIVRLYGAAALPRLVRAFADEKLPVDLEGLDLWQVAFQGAGLDLGAVLDAFGRELDRQAERHAAELAALPRPRVRLVRLGGRIGVEPLLDDADALERFAYAGNGIPLRFKPTPSSPTREYDFDYGRPGEPVFRPRARVRNAQVCVQVGIELDEGLLYEPWTCLPTADAIGWLEDEESEDE